MAHGTNLMRPQKIDDKITSTVQAGIRVREFVYRALTTVVLVCAHLVPQVQAGELVYTLDILASPAEQALTQLGRQTNHSVLFQSEQVSPLKLPALLGQFKLEQALQTLLADTDLSYGLTSGGVITITRYSEASVQAGEQQMPETNNSSAKKLRNTITSLVAALLGMGAQGAVAQENDNPIIDEIIVTAQRREQDLHEVPIAITAISGTELENSGVPDVAELGMVAPSLRITTSTSESFGSVIRMRGVGTAGGNAGLEGSVGVFVDGVYRSRTGIAMNDLIDIQRIEVLRGAQGTLFGKNTSAGAIHIITQKPDFEFGGAVDGSIGNYDMRRVRGTVTGPVIDNKLALRFSGTVNKRDGFVDDVPTGRDFNDRDRFVLRGQALFTPNESIEARLIIDYSEKDERCCASPFSQYGPSEAIITALGGTVIPDDEFDRNVAVDGNFVNTADDFGSSLEVNWNMGDLLFTSITAYREYDAFGSGDVDRNSIDIANDTTDFSVETFTQEFRLQGTKGKWDWLVGAYYFAEDIERDNAILYGAQAGDWFAALVPPPFRPLISPLYPEGGGAVSSLFKQETTGWAIFTHNVIELTPSLNLVLGLRYSDESKDGSGTFVTNSPSCDAFTPDSPFAPLRVLCPVPDFQTDLDNQDPTGTVKLQYVVSDSMNTYASYSRGFKAGGINLGRTAGLDEAGFNFDPETVDSYEIGAKGRFFNGGLRVNLAGFYSEFEDFQLNTFNGTQFIISNAAGVKTKGVEFDGMLAPGAGWLLNAGLAYTDASYTNNTEDPVLAGEQLTNAPRWTINAGVGNATAITSSLEVFGRINASYNSSFNTGSNLAPEKHQSSYTRVNARLGLRAKEVGWELIAWAANLLDEDYNLIIIETPIQSGSFSAFTGSPRTYGVTARMNF